MSLLPDRARGPQSRRAVCVNRVLLSVHAMRGDLLDLDRREGAQADV